MANVIKLKYPVSTGAGVPIAYDHRVYPRLRVDDIAGNATHASIVYVTVVTVPPHEEVEKVFMVSVAPEG